MVSIDLFFYTYMIQPQLNGSIGAWGSTMQNGWESYIHVQMKSSKHNVVKLITIHFTRVPWTFII